MEVLTKTNQEIILEGFTRRDPKTREAVRRFRVHYDDLCDSVNIIDEKGQMVAISVLVWQEFVNACATVNVIKDLANQRSADNAEARNLELISPEEDEDDAFAEEETPEACRACDSQTCPERCGNAA